MNLAQAENQEGVMKKWLKRLNSTPFGLVPAEAELSSYQGSLCRVASSLGPAGQKRTRVGKTPPRLELFLLFSTKPQVGHLVFESATAAQKTSIFKTPLFWVPARFLCSAIKRS